MARKHRIFSPFPTGYSQPASRLRQLVPHGNQQMPMQLVVLPSRLRVGINHTATPQHVPQADRTNRSPAFQSFTKATRLSSRNVASTISMSGPKTF